MKITLFTSNNFRHNYFINLLSHVASELFVVQEANTIFPGEIPGHYEPTALMKKYFANVFEAQYKIFGTNYIKNENKNIKIFVMKSGDLNKCSINLFNDFLKSDIYIVFGSSYIKGDLVNFLIDKKAINIHMGVSPYYRGCDCNFWALYDQNPHLVGATIHLLSKGLDSGSILYNAMSEMHDDKFVYTMSTVKSAFHSLAQRIKDKSIFEIQEETQDKSKEIRYSKKLDFNDSVVKDFLAREKYNNKNFILSLLKNPFFLKKDNFFEKV